MKNFKTLTLSLALLGIANLPAITLPANTKVNHAILHASLLLANLFVPTIVNCASEIKAGGFADQKTSIIRLYNLVKKEVIFKHVTDFYQLFKKDVVAEGQTPKTFRQKWTEFAQTHKTSTALIQTQLAALAFSGVCGAYTQRKYGYILKCLLKKTVLTNPDKQTPEEWYDGRAIYCPNGAPKHLDNDNLCTDEKCPLNKKCVIRYVDKIDMQDSVPPFKLHPCML